MVEFQYCAPGHIFCNAKKILLAVDGSEGSARAATVAFEVAEMTNSKLSILHVIPTAIVKQVALMTDGNVDEIMEKYTKKGQALLDGVKAAVGEHDIEVELILDKGSPADRILQQVKDMGADLVVIGSFGTSSGRRAGLGSSVERVTKGIDVPVLVV